MIELNDTVDLRGFSVGPAVRQSILNTVDQHLQRFADHGGVALGGDHLLHALQVPKPFPHHLCGEPTLQLCRRGAFFG